MKRSPPRSRKPRTAGKASNLKNSAKSMRGAATRRASIFQNGRNQAVRLPQDLKFPESVKEAQVKRHGDSILYITCAPGLGVVLRARDRGSRGFSHPARGCAAAIA